MYAIVMNENKTLRSLSTICLYQRENLVDKIRILLPVKYNELDLSSFNVVLTYVDTANIPHSELLELQDELYKDRLCYHLPVDTKLSKFAGDVKIRLSLSYLDLDERKQYALETSDYTITILPVNDYFAITPDENLSFINQKMMDIDTKLKEAEYLSETFAKNQVDDLVLTDDLLQVTANGKIKGSGVKILAPTIKDDLDNNPNDGIIDLDDSNEIDKDDSSSSSIQYVEL